MALDNRAYWLWLQQGLGAGSRKLRPFLKRFGSPRLCFEAGIEAWRQWEKFSQKELERLVFYTPSYGDALLRYAQALDETVLTPEQWGYPRPLRYLADPPCALYVKGKLPFFEGRPWIAIVGSRDASEEECQAAHQFAVELSKAGAVIVSGGALGIDGAAHRGALDAEGETVCVLGCGLSYPYLSAQLPLREEIAMRGALLTEYPPDTPPLPLHFPVRNRLISGLCDGVIVMSAGEKSGSLVTARLAVKQGRTVMVGVPEKESLSPGCEKLLANGVPVVSSAEEVLSFLGNRILEVQGAKPETEETQSFSVLETYVASPEREEQKVVWKTLEPEEKKPLEGISEDGEILLRKINGGGTRQASDLARELSIPVARVLAAATELELLGYIRSYSGGRYGPAGSRR